MKVTLYMEITANGCISGIDDDTSWVSPEAWDQYLEKIKRMDAIVIGKNTYGAMPVEEFQKNKFYIVITHKIPEKPKITNILFTDKSPNEVLQLLNDKGYQNVCVSGGSEINTLFMKAHLIDEVFMDVEPYLIGKGVPLFSPDEFEKKLELIELNKLSPNTVQLHYKVLK